MMGQESLVNYLNYRKKKKNWDIWEPFPELRVKTLCLFFFFSVGTKAVGMFLSLETERRWFFGKSKSGLL